MLEMLLFLYSYYFVSLACGDSLALCHIAVLGVSGLLFSACTWMCVVTHMQTRALGLLCPVVYLHLFLLWHLHALIIVWRPAVLRQKHSVSEIVSDCTSHFYIDAVHMCMCLYVCLQRV